MRVALALGTLAGLLCLPASPVAAQPVEASLSFVSDPGDYIGGGESRLFTIDTASVSVRGNQDGRYVGVTVFPFAGGFWFVDLAAPEGARLDPGAYEGAIRYPFQAPGQPGLSVYGDGRGCNTLTGRFDVLESRFGPGGYVERFHATFEQHCEGGAAALRGEIFIVNPPPPPALGLELTVDSAGRVDQRTGKARVSGTLRCTIATSANRYGVLTQRLTRFALASSSANVYAPCSPVPSRWVLELTPQSTVPFGPGMAQVEVQASAYDEYYGNAVTLSKTAAVKLTPSR
jgi:hypothetical protein